MSFLFLMAGEECAGSEFIASIRKHARPHHASTPDDLLQRPIITDGPGEAARLASVLWCCRRWGAAHERWMSKYDFLSSDGKASCAVRADLLTAV